MLALLWIAGAALAVDAPRVHTGIVIDGHLDEPAWQEAAPITKFVKFAPTEGGEPPGPTEVRIVHDDHALYIAVRMDHGRRVRYRWAPREDLNQDDQIGIFLDTFREEYAGYVFYFNPIGVQQDLRVNSERWNFYWDAVHESKGTVDGTAWNLEVAIPFSSLKYPAGTGPQEWGLFVQRIDIDTLATYSFPETERGAAALFAGAEPLRLEPPPRGSGLEIVPSLTAIQQGSREPGEPMEWTGFDKPLEAFRPSLDLRFGITPNIGFTGTVNPDFSQVENDETPIELNQRFAFWFEERRPFFLDGADLFEDRAGLLYSRSIVEPIGGIKVGGKEGPISIGVLHAIDRSPAASIHEFGSPGFSEEEVEGAWAANTVARVVTEAFGSGAVGVSFADKRILRLHPEQDDTAGFNDALVIDTYAPLPRRWILAGSLMGSLTGDGRNPMIGGAGGELHFGRLSGVGTGGFVAGKYTTEGLRFETGFEPQSGYGEVVTGVDHTFEPPVFDTVAPGVEGGLHLEDDGDGWYWAQAEVEAHAGAHGLGAWVVRQGEWLDDVRVDGWHVGGWYWTRPTAWLEMNPSGETQRVLDYQRMAPAQLTAADLRMTLWPTRHIRFDSSFGLRWLAPEEDDIERSTRLRGKVGYQFTQTLGTRVIAEYAAGSDVDDAFTGSVLLTWLLHPGTGVWVGYAEAATLAGKYEVTERTVFVKASVLIRPKSRARPSADDTDVLGMAEPIVPLLGAMGPRRAG